MLSEFRINREKTEAMRDTNITSKLLRRTIKENSYAEAIMRFRSEQKSMQDVKLEGWRSRKKALIENLEKEYTEYSSHMTELNRRRCEAILIKQLRRNLRAQTYFNKIREDKEQLNRKQIVLRERKLESAHRLFATLDAS